MTELINFEEESFGVGSLNHSFAQAQITTLLSVDERVITFYTITAWTKGINLIMSCHIIRSTKRTVYKKPYYQGYRANLFSLRVRLKRISNHARFRTRFALYS